MIHLEYWNSFLNLLAPATMWLSNDLLLDQIIKVEFPAGCYGLSELNNTLELQLAINATPAQGTGQIRFVGESASGRLAIKFLTDDPWRVWLNDTDFAPLREIMGFSTSQLYIPGPGPALNSTKDRGIHG